MGINIHNSIVVCPLSLPHTCNTTKRQDMISTDAHGYVPLLHREGDLVC